MTSNAPFLHCRLCGVRYRSDEVIDHEKQCSYQNPNSKGSSKSMEEPAPLSSKDSRGNELRDNEEYYKQETKTKGSSENQPKDLTSNEESEPSRHAEPRDSHSKSEITNSHTVSQIGSNRPPASHSKTEVKTTYDSSTNCETKTETKTYYGPDGRVIKIESNVSYHEPESHENESGSNEKKSEDTFISSSESEAKPPQKSHLNENARDESDPEHTDNEKATSQKSDQEQKEAMMKTPYPSEEDIKVPSIAAEEVGEAADVLEHLPEMSEKAEMAFEQHAKSLVPCVHCERTFRPDRLAIHERACIQRPKVRTYIVPEENDEKKSK